MVQILITGDFCPYDRVKRLIDEKNYKEVFCNFIPLTRDADYSIVNLECPVVLSKGTPIIKQGPNLWCTPNAIEALEYAGFDMVTLANNHFYDYGDKGVGDTLKACHSYDIDTVGGGRNIDEAQKVFYKILKNRKFALVNFCEHEFSIASSQHGGSNPLNPIANHYQIKEARKNADYVIVIVHGGHEHYQLPSPRMKETYRFFIDSGADSVINYHQHCFSGYEVYKEKPIFYGLGNFCFDWDGKRNSTWNYGYAVKLLVEDVTIDFELYPYKQGNENPGIEILKDTAEFNENINRLNYIIEDDYRLNKYFDEFVKSHIKEVVLVFEPYSNRYLSSLRKRNFLPSFINKKSLLKIRNYIECEAHRDVIIKALRLLTDEKNFS